MARPGTMGDPAEALRRLEIPDDMRRQHGFAPLGPANGLVKSAVFGLLVTFIAVFEGYDAAPTAEGVGRATTRTVVISSLAVLATDFVLTAMMFSTP